MNTFQALVKREFLDGKNGYLHVPLILAGIALLLVLLSSFGLGTVTNFELGDAEFRNLSEAMNRGLVEKPDELPAIVALGYWAMSLLAWVAFPFVIFFSLLGALYEERRDRTILFWKSMPVSDWQEVLAKFLTPILVAPLIFIAVTIVLQLAIALVLSVVLVVQHGPVGVLWPLGLMVSGWTMALIQYLMWILWAAPVLAWVLLVSAFAPRMPFLWVVLPPFVLIAIEGLFTHTHYLADWLGIHLGGWRETMVPQMSGTVHGPRELTEMVFNMGMGWQSLLDSLASAQFWFGLLITAGFLFTAIQLRKRAV